MTVKVLFMTVNILCFVCVVCNSLVRDIVLFTVFLSFRFAHTRFLFSRTNHKLSMVFLYPEMIPLRCCVLLCVFNQSSAMCVDVCCNLMQALLTNRSSSDGKGTVDAM